MIPTILLSIVIAAAFFAIVGKGIYNRKHHKSGCGSCGDPRSSRTNTSGVFGC